MLIALAYLFNVGYKYIFQHASVQFKNRIAVAIFIIGGWLSMLFGLRVQADTLVDMRMVPVIVAALVFPNPRTVLLIGAGIGIGRLFFNYDINGWLAFASMIVLGLAGMGLSIWLRKLNWRFVWKCTAAVLVLNLVYTLNAMLAHLLVPPSPYEYWVSIGYVAFPLRVLLSAVFIAMVRDFQKEQMRVEELRAMNMLLRRQTRELREAKREVEEKAGELLLASRYKSEFLANMSHELKTPLNSIILLSQLIRDNDEGRYEHDEVSYAGLIQTAGNELLQLINDILDLSKVEAGKIDVVFEPVLLRDFVQALQQQFQPLADQKGLQFEIETELEAPDSLVTDELRLNQILRNLLVNAIKFTEQGSVKLTIRLETSPGLTELRGTGRRRNWNFASWGRPVKRPVGVQRISFTVSDTGIGIDPEKQKLIFEAFQQGDGAINRKYGGTGLGLSISLQLARLLGGGLTLQSEKGTGSSFTLSMPTRPLSLVSKTND